MSSSQLVFGYNVSGSLKVLKVKFMSESYKTNMMDFVSWCKEYFSQATSLAKNALASSQSEANEHFDGKTIEQQFPGCFSGPNVV